VDIDIVDDDGDPVFSAALEQTADLSGILGNKNRKGKVQVKILEILKENGGTMDKEKLRELLPEVKKSSFYNALKLLKDSGEIVSNETIVWVNVESI
jgi:hypothetical protein